MNRSWILLSAHLFPVKVVQRAKIVFIPAFCNVPIILIGDIGMPEFNRGALFIRMQDDGHDRFFRLIAEIPLLDDLLSWFLPTMLPSHKENSEPGSADISALSPDHNSIVLGLVNARYTSSGGADNV